MSERWTFNGESVLDEKGRNVCTKVNGPRIAAVPELIEALRALIASFDETASLWELQQAREVLAKATGGAS